MEANQEEPNPIGELRTILDEADEEIANLFGPALTIFAGPSASIKDEKEKLADLARILEIE